MTRPVLTVLVLLFAWLAAGQQGSPVPEDTGQTPSPPTAEAPAAQQSTAAAQQEPTPPPRKLSVDPTFCAEADQSFGRNFEIYGLVIAGGLLCAVVPLLLPPLLGFRWWWLTQPTLRWVVLFITGAFLVGFLWIALPSLGRDTSRFQRVGLIAFPDVPPKYYECIELARSGAESGGFSGATLFGGLLGSGTAPLVAQTGALLIAYFLTMTGIVVLALGVRRIRMRWYGLPERVSRGFKG